MEIKELFLKTTFCCMACDGDIATEEVELVEQLALKSHLFEGLDINAKLYEYIAAINEKGEMFLKEYLACIPSFNLSENDELQLAKLAVQMIEADNKIEYSEIAFFKKIRLRLKISDAAILKEMPDKEDFLLPDIIEKDDFDFIANFENISINI